MLHEENQSSPLPRAASDSLLDKTEHPQPAWRTVRSVAIRLDAMPRRRLAHVA